MANCLKQFLRLPQWKAQTQQEDARITFVNAVCEVILLRRGDGVVDDRHLAIRGKLYGGCQTGGTDGAVAGAMQAQRPAFLKPLVAGYQQNCLVHRCQCEPLLRSHTALKRMLQLTPSRRCPLAKDVWTRVVHRAQSGTAIAKALMRSAQLGASFFLSDAAGQS
jgi:hypothetical protein